MISHIKDLNELEWISPSNDRTKNKLNRYIVFMLPMQFTIHEFVISCKFYNSLSAYQNCKLQSTSRKKNDLSRASANCPCVRAIIYLDGKKTMKHKTLT